MTLDPRVAPDADAASGLCPAPGAVAGADEPTPRPQRGDELELSIDSLAFGGEGVARLGDGGYVVFVAGAIPGDRVRAVVHKRKRSYAHARARRDPRAEPRADRAARRPSGRAVAGAPLRAPARDQARAGRRRAAADRPARRVRAGGDRAGAGAVALPQQARVLLRRSRRLPELGRGSRGLVCGFHAPAGGNSVVAIEDCLLASERGNLARETALALVPRAGPHRVGARSAVAAARSDADGEPTERVERRTSERVGPDPDGRARLRNLVVREGRRTGQLQIRIVTTDGELEAGVARAGAERGAGREPLRRAVDALAQPRGDDRGRRHRAGVGRGRAARAPRRARPAHLPRGVLPDEHRDGRAALRGGRRVRGAGGLGARLRPLLAGSARSRSRSPRAPASCGGSS